jgi:2-succinyl-5-enolpyruvyl-6-hydroxy-3-cyclohexene-1-carboxylate synthase
VSETEGDVALRCLFAYVDQLAFEGLEHACVSPGSRSTPIALAFARHPRITVHVHLDERASAFFALGISKSTGKPVAVVTTSGTAAAELFPAVVEASMSRVPVLLLTADRPLELRGVGANQTIDQTELFGGYVRTYLDAPVPGDDPDEWGWRQRAEFVMSTALRHPPGPVHINVPLREPLAPSAGIELEQMARTVASESVLEAVPAERSELLEEIRATAHGILVAGSIREPEPDLLHLAERLGWPVLAEPTSGLRVPGTLEAGQFLVSNDRFVDAHVPDVVLQVGAAPTTRAGLAFVARAARLWIVDPDDLVADPNRTASGRVVLPLRQLIAVIDRVPARDDDGWRTAWNAADQRARAAVDATIDAWPDPFEGRVARDVAECLPDGSTVVVGSSMPVRDLDLFMRPRDGLRVLANRGASGIDGFVSAALGVAATGARTTALCGDLTFLHDIGSLVWSAGRGHDAVFVVPNNEGGAIFSFLPQRGLPEFEELFVTPHGTDLGALCAAAGAGHETIRRADDLVPAIERAHGTGGVHVLEVPSDRETNFRRHGEVHEAVADALARP